MLQLAVQFLLYATVIKSFEESEDEQLDTLIKEVMECYPSTASFAISAVKEGRVEYNRAYGKANIEKGVDATENTRFTIGSISKSFTSYVTGKQVIDGQFDWKENVVDLFAKKGISMSFRGPMRKKFCNLEDALAHRTGLHGYGWLLNNNVDVTRAQWTTTYLPQFEQLMEMREGWYYNNWLYTMLGYLADLYSGTTYEQMVKRTIFGPLEMSQSMFVSDQEYDELDDAEFAVPYRQGRDETSLYPVPRHAMKYIASQNPAGGIVSTAGDMAKYMIGILNALSKQEDAVLNRTILEHITKPRLKMDGYQAFTKKPQFPETFDESFYAYGYQTGSYRGYDMIHHGGATMGHYSFITMVPSLQLGVFSVISGSDLHRENISRMQMPIQLYILDRMMGLDPWLDKDKICTFPDTWKSNAPPSQQYKPRDSHFSDILFRKTANFFDSEYNGSLKNIPNPEIYVGKFSNPAFPDVIDVSWVGEERELKFSLGESNGTIAGLRDGRLEFVVDRPTDPLNFPTEDKSRVFLKYTFSHTISDNVKIESVEAELVSEKYIFKLNSCLRTRSRFALIVISLVCRLFLSG